MLAGLEKPTDGQILFKKQSVSTLSLNKMRPLRRNIQMIFQNSGSVFDPSYTIGQSIAEVIHNCEHLTKRECHERVNDILERVGLDPSYASRSPMELSGGQIQRANIARALVLNPEFVICDEPVSSLDYSLRKQILTLLNDLRNQFNLTYLFITHDLHCVPYVCDVLVILYAGKVMEQIDLNQHSIEDILHPYTRLLLSSIPVKEPALRKKTILKGMPELFKIPDTRSCCRFFPRCPFCTELCENTNPSLKEVDQNHFIACHHIL
jgi:peptide/nickel transport system ATP-binding protein